MPRNNVVDSRIFWDSLVTNTINKFEYDAISAEKFVEHMGHLGFNPEDIKEIYELQ